MAQDGRGRGPFSCQLLFTAFIYSFYLSLVHQASDGILALVALVPRERRYALTQQIICHISSMTQAAMKKS